MMNEETLKIIANQKKDIENLREYVDAGFKVICDWGKKDHRKINFLRFFVGVMAVAIYRQNIRLKKLEKQLDREEPVEINVENDPVEKVSAE